MSAVKEAWPRTHTHLLTSAVCVDWMFTGSGDQLTCSRTDASRVKTVEKIACKWSLSTHCFITTDVTIQAVITSNNICGSYRGKTGTANWQPLIGLNICSKSTGSGGKFLSDCWSSSRRETDWCHHRVVKHCEDCRAKGCQRETLLLLYIYLTNVVTSSFINWDFALKHIRILKNETLNQFSNHCLFL